MGVATIVLCYQGKARPPQICWHWAPSSGPHQQLVGSTWLPTTVKVTAVLYCHVCCWCRGEDLFGMEQHLHNWLHTPSAYDVLFVRWGWTASRIGSHTNSCKVMLQTASHDKVWPACWLCRLMHPRAFLQLVLQT